MRKNDKDKNYENVHHNMRSCYLTHNKKKKKNTPLLKQFQSPIEKSQIEAKVISLEQNKCMIAHFPLGNGLGLRVV
jgi:hypothetical protein